MTTYHYDMNGRITGRTDEDGYQYDENGRMIGRIDSEGYFRDDNNRVVGRIDSSNNFRDCNNRVTAIIDDEGNQYDAYGRKTGVSKTESSGGCYLTTACVEYKGLSDNCKELTTLRKFRDDYMSQESMKSDVDAYYKIAPSIVEGISKLNENQRKEIYDSIYNTVIKCVELIESNNFEEAYIDYKKMVQAVSIYR